MRPKTASNHKPCRGNKISDRFYCFASLGKAHFFCEAQAEQKKPFEERIHFCMPNQKNTNTIEQLKEKVKKAKSITFVDYLGLKVNDINELRQQMTDQEAEPVIARNTLIKLALKEEGMESEAIDEQLKGPTAAIFSYKDPVAYLKPLYEFA